MSGGGESWPASAGVLVRRVRAGDWAVYRQVRLAALADSPESFSSTLERELALTEQDWRDRLGSAATFLAWQDGQPAGTATSLPYSPAYKHGRSGARMLVAMWVDPRARRLGVGRLLVEAVADHARAAGAPSVVLRVYETNSRARDLYQRTGFQESGVRVPRPGLVDEWELLLVRELG